jgi:hypothetical protein
MEGGILRSSSLPERLSITRRMIADLIILSGNLREYPVSKILAVSLQLKD